MEDPVPAAATVPAAPAESGAGDLRLTFPKETSTTDIAWGIVSQVVTQHPGFVKGLLGLMFESNRAEALFNFHYETWYTMVKMGKEHESASKMGVVEYKDMLGNLPPDQLKAAAKKYLERRIATQGSATDIQKEQLRQIEEWVDKKDFESLVKITW